MAYFGLQRLTSSLAGMTGLARARLVILYYHGVPRSDRPKFAAQMDRVLAGADAVVPADFQGAAQPRQLLVAVTFDDAFASVAENALPELRMRGMPATIFAPSGCLGRAPCWRMDADADGWSETILGAEILPNLVSNAISVGSHSVSHPSLAKADRHTAEAEILGSKRQLTELLGHEVDLFSFPYGEYNAATVQLCRDAKYRFAFTTEPSVLNPASDGILRGRVLIRPDETSLEFWLKMRGAYAWLPLAWAIKRRLVRHISRKAAHKTGNIASDAQPGKQVY
jgi:peptidoglycan/xylan/chitin deacetylase (PgdA/CDA1 family)